jgi:hypothetical protein
MLLQVLFLLKRRVTTFVVALKWTIFAMHIFDVNLQLGACGEGRRTLIAVVVLDLEMTLQMLLDVLFFEGAEATNVAFESFLLQVNSLIVTTQV